MSSQLLTVELAKKIAERTAYYYSQAKQIEEKLITNEIAKVKLKDAGIDFNESEWSNIVRVNSEDIEAKPEFLKSVYKVLGRLKDTGEREVVDSRKRIISVKLEAVAYPGVRITYLHKINKGDKCQIKTEKTSKTRVQKYKTVVCGK